MSPSTLATALTRQAFRLNCDCGCEAMPVAYCLINDRSCLRASQMAEAIIERVAGEPYIDIQLDRSINQGPIVGVDLEQLPQKQAKELMSRITIMQCTCGCQLGLLRCLSLRCDGHLHQFAIVLPEPANGDFRDHRGLVLDRAGAAIRNC